MIYLLNKQVGIIIGRDNTVRLVMHCRLVHSHDANSKGLGSPILDATSCFFSAFGTKKTL